MFATKVVWDLKIGPNFQTKSRDHFSLIFFMQIFLMKFGSQAKHHWGGKYFSFFFWFLLFLLFSFFMLFRGKFAIKFRMFTHYASDQNMHVYVIRGAPSQALQILTVLGCLERVYRVLQPGKANQPLFWAFSVKRMILYLSIDYPVLWS